jgi:hypothetical protein
MDGICEPAMFYLVISTILFIFLLLQNVGNTEVYCLGSYSCDVNNSFMILFIQILYILLWTFLLNAICKNISPIISWVIVLIPILLFFIFTGTLFTFGTDNSISRMLGA